MRGYLDNLKRIFELYDALESEIYADRRLAEPIKEQALTVLTELEELRAKFTRAADQQ